MALRKTLETSGSSAAPGLSRAAIVARAGGAVKRLPGWHQVTLAGERLMPGVWRRLRRRYHLDSGFAVEEAAFDPGLEWTVAQAIDARFPDLQPLPTFPEPGEESRITIVTDSISAGSVFGGVGTAMILGSLMSRRMGIPLRVATRTEAPVPGNLGEVLAALGVRHEANIEFILASDRPGGRALPLTRSDILLTTSWWTTRSALGSVPPERIVYLLQEDERMFYPAGDQQLRCAETLDDPRLRFVVNTAMLRDHFIADGLRGAGAGSVSFEPAFPEDIYFREPREPGAKRRFFFYARPNNARNLFHRGIEAIAAAIEAGVLDPEEWEFHFAGKDIPRIILPGNVEAERHEGLPWRAYAALARSVDLGLCLMLTPHPSYPPLDLAASGAVVVTNGYGPKRDLTGLSPNILCVEPSVGGLVEGLRGGVALARDAARREANFRAGTIARDWETSFAPVLDQLVPGG